jgi:hypothetical protein
VSTANGREKDFKIFEMTKPAKTFLAIFAILLCLLAAACSPSGETGLEGTVLFAERPVAGATVEVYLRAEKDRATLPFTSVATDENGRYQLNLPAGRYYLIGKKKDESADGRSRMLLGECPANPLEVEKAIGKAPTFSLREMGRDGELAGSADTGTRGRLMINGQPLAHAFVYVYTEKTGGLMGPSYGTAVQSDVDGRFTVNLPPGRYFLAARQRADGSRVGEVTGGDLNGVYPGNPIEVNKGQILDLGDFPLQPVDADRNRQRRAEGRFVVTDTALSGRVVDADREPVAGISVFAYLDSRMVGKPTYLSAPSDGDGRFVIYLGEGGTYFLGARGSLGGPLEPGERVGTYDGDPRHAVAVERGQSADIGTIQVREVW